MDENKPFATEPAPHPQSTVSEIKSFVYLKVYLIQGISNLTFRV